MSFLCVRGQSCARRWKTKQRESHFTTPRGRDRDRSIGELGSCCLAAPVPGSPIPAPALSCCGRPCSGHLYWRPCALTRPCLADSTVCIDGQCRMGLTHKSVVRQGRLAAGQELSPNLGPKWNSKGRKIRKAITHYQGNIFRLTDVNFYIIPLLSETPQRMLFARTHHIL